MQIKRNYDSSTVRDHSSNLSTVSSNGAFVCSNLKLDAASASLQLCNAICNAIY